jgi:hypothetical protein
MFRRTLIAIGLIGIGASAVFTATTPQQCAAIKAQLDAAQKVYADARAKEAAALADVEAKKALRDAAYAKRNDPPKEQNMAAYAAAEKAWKDAILAHTAAQENTAKARTQVNALERKHEACIAQLPQTPSKSGESKSKGKR